MLGKMWESVLRSGKVWWDVGKVWGDVVVWGSFGRGERRSVGVWGSKGRCGERCGGAEKCWVRYGEVCCSVGEVGEMWRSVQKCVGV